MSAVNQDSDNFGAIDLRLSPRPKVGVELLCDYRSLLALLILLSRLAVRSLGCDVCASLVLVV